MVRLVPGMNKNDAPSCWYCVWREIYGACNDPTLRCAHGNAAVRNGFKGCSSALNCEKYLEDDPKIQISVVRETTESLMCAVHKMVVAAGQYQEAQGLVEVYRPEHPYAPKPLTSCAFTFTAHAHFGSNEGAYVTCAAKGQISDGGQAGTWDLGFYRTHDDSLEAMQILGALAGSLTYFADKYIQTHLSCFLPMRELRADAIKKRLAMDRQGEK